MRVPGIERHVQVDAAAQGHRLFERRFANQVDGIFLVFHPADDLTDPSGMGGDTGQDDGGTIRFHQPVRQFREPFRPPVFASVRSLHAECGPFGRPDALLAESFLQQGFHGIQIRLVRRVQDRRQIGAVRVMEIAAEDFIKTFRHAVFVVIPPVQRQIVGVEQPLPLQLPAQGALRTDADRDAGQPFDEGDPFPRIQGNACIEVFPAQPRRNLEGLLHASLADIIIRDEMVGIRQQGHDIPHVSRGK